MHRGPLLGLIAVTSAYLCATAPAQDITTGMVAHWALDELPGATTAVDSIGARNGSVQGSISTGVAGRVGRAYSFPTVAGDRVLTSATATALGMNSGAFSMFAYIKTPLIGADQRHIISANVSGQIGRWNLSLVENSGDVQWFHHNGLPNFWNPVVDDDQWHLVGVSKSASGAYTQYIDGQSLALGTNASAPLADAFITLGARPTSNNFMFKGLIDDVRIYNRVLSATDIQGLLDQPAPEPVTGDYDNSGVVDIKDYVLWRMSENTMTDLDNDDIGGEIGQSHYGQWAENYGDSMFGIGAGNSYAVPEPASCVIVLAIGLLSTFQRPRREH